jgi:hypothetical protein
VKDWGTAKVDWREAPALWGFLGWLAGTLWPPLPFTWLLWPPTREAGGFLHDWRVVVAVAGAIGVAVIMRLIAAERRREGAPRTRFGVLVRFVAYGFLAALLAAVGVALVGAVMSLFAPGDAFRRIGEIKAAFLMGLATLPVALVVGVSYAVWAGFIVGVVSFAPRAQNVRPSHFLFDTLHPVDAPPPAPMPPVAPMPAGPHPETDMERALRADTHDDD